MEKMIQKLLVVMVIIASFCGSAWAEQAGKDWYLALRFGYSPYTLEEDGTLLGRDFSAKADLKDIMDKTDTTLFGGEVEFGMGKWFGVLSTLYQKSETNDGTLSHGANATLKEVVVNPMIGYRVYQEKLEGDQSLTIDGLAGLSYVKVSWDMSLYNDRLGNLYRSNDFEIVDPMIGARLRYMFTKQFGMTVLGQIGGFGVSSELQYNAAANLIYSFNECFSLSAGYRYWYFKYEDDSANLSKLEQKMYGPLVGVQFLF
jgi:hypothetical protein